MARPKGSPKLGGRAKGTPNKATAKREAEIAASGLTPLQYMLRIMRDVKKPAEIRFEAAKAAAPYVHPKLAAVEHSGPSGGPIEHKDVSARDVLRSRIARLTDTEPG